MILLQNHGIQQTMFLIVN